MITELLPKMSRHQAIQSLRSKLATAEQRAQHANQNKINCRLFGQEDVVNRAERQTRGAIDRDFEQPENHDNLSLVLLAVRSADACYFCGDTPAACGTPDLTADRIDSSMSYQEAYQSGLLVAACWFCNQAKSDSPLDLFLQLAKNVVDFQDRGVPATAEIYPRQRNLDWWLFRASSRARNLEVRLTREEFDVLRKKPCHHCGLVGPKGGGIDRLHNNNRFYDSATSVPCCWACNCAKLNHAVELFYRKCRAIVARHFA